MEGIRQGGGEGYDNSIRRFVTAANRLSAFASSGANNAVTYAFDTLEAVSRDDTIWSLVFDPVNLNFFFRTYQNAKICSLEISKLDFSCQTPVKMMEIHKNVSGDISNDLVTYKHSVNFKHSKKFFSENEGVSISPILVDILLRGVESFPCKEDGNVTRDGLASY